MTKAANTSHFYPARAPNAKLKDISEGYRVATEAYALAAELGCSGDLADALWSLVTREAKTAIEGAA